MKTLTVAIDETEYNRLGFESDIVPFSELRERINTDFAKAALVKCHQMAKETGLAEMSMEEINAEIQAVRDNAKNCT